MGNCTGASNIETNEAEKYDLKKDIEQDQKKDNDIVEDDYKVSKRSLTTDEKQKAEEQFFVDNKPIKEISRGLSKNEDMIFNYIQDVVVDLSLEQQHKAIIYLQAEYTLEQIAEKLIPSSNLKSVEKWYNTYQAELLIQITPKQEAEIKKQYFKLRKSVEDIAHNMNIMCAKVSKYVSEVVIELTPQQQENVKEYLDYGSTLEEISQLLLPKSNLKSIEEWHRWYEEDRDKPLTSEQKQKIKKQYLDQSNSVQDISNNMSILESKIQTYINELKQGKSKPINGSILIYDHINFNLQESEQQLTQYLLPFHKFQMKPNFPPNEEQKKLIKGECCCQYESKYQYNLLILGKSGSGKTTLLDSFVNYLMSIEVFDKFRYRLVDESEEVEFGKQGDDTQSKTKYSTIYHIPQNEIKQGPFQNKECCINIIDTPGFGDTKGVKQDKANYKIVCQQIKKLAQLDAILLVTKHNITRYNEFQEYIFKEIQSIFAEDLMQRFIMTSTFSDGSYPKSLKALKKAGFYISKHCEFNNGMVFYKDVINNKNKMFMHQFGLRQYEQLSKIILDQGIAVNMVQTKQLIKTRDLMNATVSKCQQKAKVITFEILQIKQQKKDVIEKQEEINSKGSYETFSVQIELEEETSDHNHTVCWSCPKSQICHEGCKSGESKENCSVMGPGSRCTKCNHRWEAHRNSLIVWKEKIVKKDVVLTADQGQQGLTLAQQVLEYCNKRLLHHVNEYCELMSIILKYNDTISELGFNKQGYKTTKYYETQLELIKKNNDLSAKEQQQQIAFYENLIDQSKFIQKATTPCSLGLSIEEIMINQILKEMHEEEEEMQQHTEIQEQEHKQQLTKLFEEQRIKLKEKKENEEKERIQKLNDDVKKIQNKITIYFLSKYYEWNDDEYDLYGLHNRIIYGENKSKRPNFATDHTKKQWDAWNYYRFTSNEDIKSIYLNAANKILSLNQMPDLQQQVTDYVERKEQKGIWKKSSQNLVGLRKSYQPIQNMTKSSFNMTKSSINMTKSNVSFVPSNKKDNVKKRRLKSDQQKHQENMKSALKRNRNRTSIPKPRTYGRTKKL